MRHPASLGLLVIPLILVGCSAPSTEDASVTLTIESFRSDDTSIWNEVIIPAFEESHEGISLEFAPTTVSEYDAALSSRLESGQAGDIITCRPFEGGRSLFSAGSLVSLESLPGIDGFAEHASAAWSTPEGEPFCVPITTTLGGYFYNVDIFDRLGLDEPETWDELIAVLDAIDAEGEVDPLVEGVADAWTTTNHFFWNIGPMYWGGKEFREGLLNGTTKLTDEGFVDGLDAVATLGTYLPEGASAINYQDSINYFMNGSAAVFPSGSWDIGPLQNGSAFDVGWFPATYPEEGAPCYLVEEVDWGLGINADSPNREAAETFLEWTTTKEFAELFVASVPGFFSPQLATVEVDNPLAAEMLASRDGCELDIRLWDPWLTDLDFLVEAMSQTASVMVGTTSSEDAAIAMQQRLEASDVSVDR